MRVAILVSLGVLALSPALADQSPSPAEVIAARQAGFALLAGAFQPFKATAEADKSPKPLADSAAAIAEWAAAIPSLFPVGTESGHDTKAKPEIWSDHDGFIKAAATFEAAAKKLEATAEADDAKGFADAFEATAKACGACHKAYRAKRG
jgi:cytochrome c556